MSRTPLLLLASLLLASSVFAQDAAPTAPASTDSSCEAKAIDKNGKPLAGAAKSSFMKKCAGAASNDGCAAKAIGKNGKPLVGAAKASFIKKCAADQKAGQ